MQSSQIAQLAHLAQTLGIEVRYAALGGEGGGICEIRGRRVLFIDTAADTATRLQRTARALARLDEIETCFIRPDIRELLEKHGGREDNSPPA
ncbi:MAG: hypothetical protein KAV82_16635 [Phycisphaerae bacterium]|nr:hypothetical protein [Phycisphaerae bacterium]